MACNKLSTLSLPARLLLHVQHMLKTVALPLQPGCRKPLHVRHANTLTAATAATAAAAAAAALLRCCRCPLQARLRCRHFGFELWLLLLSFLSSLLARCCLCWCWSLPKRDEARIYCTDNEDAPRSSSSSSSSSVGIDSASSCVGSGNALNVNGIRKLCCLRC